MNSRLKTNGFCHKDRRPRRRRPRVLLSAYSCCPNWGSEPGVGWKRATEIARFCDVWVLTVRDGMQRRIDAYVQEHGPIPNLEFVFVPCRGWELAIGDRWPLNYVAYRQWQRRALGVAQQLHAEVGFDVAHHITFNGFREPSYLYQLGIPFVWGPVGGAQNYPWRFLPGAGIAGASAELTRSVLNTLQLRISPRVRAAAKSASAIFAANPENQRKIRGVLGVDPILLCDVGTDELGDEVLGPPGDSRAIRILWAGRLETLKALELLIEALALLPDDVSYELHVLGEGPRLSQYQRMAEQRAVLPNVRWCGRVPHDQALEQFRWSDVLVFTSLRDTTGTVVLEALRAGKPVICLDHQGAGAVVTSECGIKIPVTNRREVERRLSDAITRLQRNRYHCRALGQGARRRAAEYLWSLQARRIADEYNRILDSVGSEARCDLNDSMNSIGHEPHDNPIDATSARVGVPLS